jgi:hypothetical protein
MNRIFAPIFNAINALFDGMNRRTADMIRQIYIFLIVVFCIIGIIIGSSMGKKSARKSGVQLADTTNSVFSIEIQTARANGKYDSILEGGMESGLDMKDAPKQTAPAREKLSPEDSLRIVEPEKDRHIKTAPDVMDRNDLSSPPRMDEEKDFSKNTKTLSRSEEKKSGVVVDKEIPPLLNDRKPEAKGDDIRSEKPIKAKEKESAKKPLKPLKKKEDLAE